VDGDGLEADRAEVAPERAGDEGRSRRGHERDRRGKRAVGSLRSTRRAIRRARAASGRRQGCPGS
jgi:hypothetical protein